jgi:hypothetical protein
MIPARPPASIPARTIRAKDGRVLIFSCQEFVDEISLGQCCFVCGAHRNDKVFNDEHVVPKWVLKRCDLFERTITLMDGQLRTYDRYKIPCCKDCNSLLGKRVETPVSKLLSGGFDAILGRLDTGAINLLFVWLCLLFLKTHLKDRSVPQHPDPRRGSGRLADGYDWGDLHHLHCVARAPFTEASIEPAVLGSIKIFKVSDASTADTFDYSDFTNQQTVSVRIDDFAIVAVLNDSGAAQMAWDMIWPRITGAISTVQLREAAALLACANSDLLNRPVFGTAYSARDDTVRLFAEHEDRPAFGPFDPAKFGEMFAFAMRDRMAHLAVGGERNPVKVEALIRSGKVRFLLDEKGDFRPQEVNWELDETGGAGADSD